MANSLHPTVLWAQRKNRLLLTIDLQGCKVRQQTRRRDDADRAPGDVF
jgi:hypothetical protein